jgi:hypothetical protein
MVTAFASCVRHFKGGDGGFVQGYWEFGCRSISVDFKSENLNILKGRRWVE